MTETNPPDPQVAVPTSLLRRLFDYAHKADVAGILGVCESDPCQVCTDMEAAQLALARGPATLADIPGGRGAASLFLRDESDAVWFKRADGRVVRSENYLHIGEPGGLGHALRDHLSATLPTIGPKGSV